MSSVLIWDLPTRLFHWFLAAGFVAAATIALVLGEDNRLFPYHAIIGLTIGLLVVIRLFWGIVGTRYARFDSFAFGPRAVVESMKGAVLGGGTRSIGHNPGSSVAIFAMLGLVPALAVTGVMIGQGREAVREAHEIIAWVMVGVVAVHVLGVALHTIHHRENIIASMIHGRKVAEPADAITSARPIVAVIFLAIGAAWVVGLIRNFNPERQTTTIPLVGMEVRLGEAEREGANGGERETLKRADDDD